VPTATAPPGHRLLHVDHYDDIGPGIYEDMVQIAEEFAERTGRSYRQTNNLIPSGHHGALARTLELYVSADLVLTSRLHGCIIALATGRKVLAVSGDHKVDAFMKTAGLADWVLDLDEIGMLPERLEALPEQKTPTQFVEWARKANRAVGQQVKLIVAASRPAFA
jgi:polysaccharide pyruvyl transferase WcaK-like protein